MREEEVANTIVMLLASIGLLTKAILETAYFQDRYAAKKTLKTWLFIIVCLALTKGFSFLIDYFS